MSKIYKKSINLGLKMLSILAFGSLFILPNIASAAYGTNIWYGTGSGSYGTNGSYDSGYNAPEDNPVPSINSINPRSSNVGVGTKTITITGSGFVPDSVARINASTRPVTFIDSSHLLVQITGNDTSLYQNNGGFYISVFNGAPGGGYSNALFFTINNIAPVTNGNNNSYNSSTTSFTDTNTYSNTNQTQSGTSSNTNSTTSANSNTSSNLASSVIFGSNTFLPSGLIQWVLLAIVILLIIILVRKVFGAKQKYDEAPMKHA